MTLPKVKKHKRGIKKNKGSTYLSRMEKNYGKDFGTEDVKSVARHLSQAGYPSLAKILYSD